MGTAAIPATIIAPREPAAIAATVHAAWSITAEALLGPSPEAGIAETMCTRSGTTAAPCPTAKVAATATTLSTTGRTAMVTGTATAATGIMSAPLSVRETRGGDAAEQQPSGQQQPAGSHAQARGVGLDVHRRCGS
ncbi:hypothetical protein [Lichenicola sp.]|uniref:hypothetical protein n=1 Tax=Lichenicola sp. TaxID=2804529 RepID=UPI003AFFDE73